MLKNCYRVLPLVLFSLTGCTSYVHRQEEVQKAMQHYDRLIQKMDADSIALLYTPDGDLDTIAHGRDTIRRFLSTFKGIQLLEVSSTTESLTMTGDTAWQKGRYKQSGIMPRNDTFHLTGTYEAQWVWLKNENGWRIRRMTTKSDKD